MQNENVPAQVILFQGQPMKVWLITQPLAKFAGRWAEPRIARVNLMVPVTAELD